MRGSTLIKTFTVVGLASLMTSACLSSSSNTSTGSAAATAGGSAAAGDVKGKTVTIWTSMDQPVVDGLNAATTEMSAASGMTVKWQKVDDINKLIMTKLTPGSGGPDIAFIPQPGVVADMVKRGAGVPLDDVVDMAALKSTMMPGTLDPGTVNGKLYGLLVSMNAKSFVWYPKKAWDAAGWKAPTSIDELNKLTEDMKAKGQTPWCLGIESGGATGWAVTDWFEDLVMRYGGADTYNKWVKGEVKFDSDVVKQAAAEFEKIAFTEGNVNGGRKSIATTSFGDAPKPMFDAKPACMMYKQGTFITNFFPDAIKKDSASLDANVGVFGFPPAKAGGDNPMLGGGDMAVLLNDTPQGRAAMKLLADPKVGEKAMASTFLSPHKTFDVTKYQGSLTQAYAKIIYGSSSFLFDGSDQMPGAVGSGSFWKETTAWVSGTEDTATMLKNIDASWPAS